MARATAERGDVLPRGVWQRYAKAMHGMVALGLARAKLRYAKQRQSSVMQRLGVAVLCKGMA